MMKKVAKKSSSISAHFFQKKIMQHRNTIHSVNPIAKIIYINPMVLCDWCYFNFEIYALKNDNPVHSLPKGAHNITLIT